MAKLGATKSLSSAFLNDKAEIYSFKDIFEDIQKSVGTNGSRHPLTYLLEAADDIAYKTADIEDSIKKGCITYKQLIEELKSVEEYLDKESTYHEMVDILERKYKKAIDKKIDRPDIYAVQNWVVSIQGQMIFSASDCFIDNYKETCQLKNSKKEICKSFI